MRVEAHAEAPVSQGEVVPAEQPYYFRRRAGLGGSTRQGLQRHLQGAGPSPLTQGMLVSEVGALFYPTVMFSPSQRA